MLFSHPRTSRRCARPSSALTAKLKAEFEKRNVKVIALSVDPVDSHKSWIRRHQGDAGHQGELSRSSPTPTGRSSTLYDMIHPNANDTLTVRSVFVIDPKKKVRLMITYPARPAATSTRSCA